MRKKVSIRKHAKPAVSVYVASLRDIAIPTDQLTIKLLLAGNIPMIVATSPTDNS